MQWAAVRTQQDEIRMPPHMWLKSSDEPLVLVCKDTCQGWVPGKDLLPPWILPVRAWVFPHWVNGEGLNPGISGVAGKPDIGSVTEEEHKETDNSTSASFTVCLGLSVKAITSRAFLDFAVFPAQLVLSFNKTPRFVISIWVPAVMKYEEQTERGACELFSRLDLQCIWKIFTLHFLHLLCYSLVPKVIKCIFPLKVLHITPHDDCVKKKEKRI